MNEVAGHIQPPAYRACVARTVASAITGKRGFASKSANTFLTLSATLLLSSTVLSGCVKSPVDNALDLAVISAPNEQISLTSQSGSVTGSDQLASTVIPVPERSPLTMNTALLPDENQSPAEQAVAGVVNDQSDIVLVKPEDGEAALDPQTAALDNSALVPSAAPADTAIQVTDPAASQLASLAPSNSGVPSSSPALPAPAKAEKPKSLFEVWFGKKTAQSATQSRTKVSTPVKKTVQPNSTVAVASATPGAPSGANGALPGVQRNSVLFGINSDENDDDDSSGNSVQVASVGSLGRLISPKGLILQTESVQVDCFKPELLQILGVVEKHYGKKVIVTSGYRSPKGNRRAGGASNSTHIYCKAADIQIEGVSKWDLAKFLRNVSGRGGVGTYCRTDSVHVDVGSQRDWHHPCRRSKRKTA